MKAKSKSQLEEDRVFRRLGRTLKKYGICLRRENLARGHAFRVKSGDCEFSGEKFLFVDRRLPYSQQLSVLVDYIVDSKLQLEQEDLDVLPSHVSSLLLSQRSAAA